MKIIKLNTPYVNVYTLLTLFAAIIVLSACGTTKYNFSTSSAVPAAEGTVKVKRTETAIIKLIWP